MAQVMKPAAKRQAFACHPTWGGARIRADGVGSGRGGRSQLDVRVRWRGGGQPRLGQRRVKARAEKEWDSQVTQEAGSQGARGPGAGPGLSELSGKGGA